MIDDNVLLTDIPTSWHGYELNTSFRIGIQISQLYYDKSIFTYEKGLIIRSLLFDNEDGTTREYPIEEFGECLEWFLGGWNHDHRAKTEQRHRQIDYDVDQWRIYADFRQIYRINLNEVDMHWWEFQAMLWNMPAKLSSLMQVISFRVKKVNANMSADEREQTVKLQKTYALDEDTEKTYTAKQREQIDAFDRMMANQKKKNIIAEEFMKSH